MLSTENEEIQTLLGKLDLCCQAERLAASCRIPNRFKEEISLKNIMEARSQLECEVFFKIGNLEISETARIWMITHLDLYRLLGQKESLTKQEFDAVFSNQAAINPTNKESMWNHNRTCFVFFMHWYRGILKCLNSKVDSVEIPDIARWLVTQLVKLEELRLNFPFCKRCVFDGQQCHFWGTVALQVNDRLSGSHRRIGVAQVRDYFQNVTILCRIPPSLDAFKNGRSF